MRNLSPVKHKISIGSDRGIGREASDILLEEKSGSSAGDANVVRESSDGQQNVGHFTGVGLLLGSVVFFSAMSLMVKLSSTRFGAEETFLFRSWTQTTVAGLICRYRGIPVWGPDGVKIRCVMRGFVGGSGTFCFFFAIVRLPLGDATALFFAAPMFTVLFCFCIGNDRVTRSDLIAVVVATVGVLFICKPSFLFPETVHSFVEDVTKEFSLGSEGGSLVVADPALRTAGIISALVGAVGAGLVPIAVRYCGPTVHYLSLTFSFGVIGMIVSILALCLRPQPVVWPSLADPNPTIFLVLAAIFATLAQCLYNAGTQLEKPTTSNMIRTLDVLANALCQAFIVGNPLTWSSFLGMALIVGSTILVLVVKMSDSRKQYKKMASGEPVAPLKEQEHRVVVIEMSDAIRSQVPGSKHMTGFQS